MGVEQMRKRRLSLVMLPNCWWTLVGFKKDRKKVLKNCLIVWSILLRVLQCFFFFYNILVSVNVDFVLAEDLDRLFQCQANIAADMSLLQIYLCQCTCWRINYKKLQYSWFFNCEMSCTCILVSVKKDNLYRDLYQDCLFVCCMLCVNVKILLDMSLPDL